MSLILVLSLLLLTAAGIISYWNYRISLILSFGVLIIAMEFGGLSTLICFLAILNIVSLIAIRKNQIVGTDYAMIGLMSIATIYAFITSDLAELLVLFVVVSVPTYLIVMVDEDRLNVDVGIKYIAFMVIATILFILGSAMLYLGYSWNNSTLYLLGFVIFLIGLAMEVGIAPFHEWVPDVFANANPIAISIIASLAKFVPFIVAFKILMLTATSVTASALLILALISAISMFVGNIGALTTQKPARILAYSTIANMGYVLAAFSAIMAPRELVYFAIAGGLMQLFVNAFGKVGFFNAVKGGSSTISNYILSFSFIGLPPLMGFWSKFFIIYALVFSNYLWLAILLVINSAISIPYYLRLVRVAKASTSSLLTNTVATITALAMLITLIPPIWFVDLVMEVFK
ncbi:MAG: NADH-quinone oxidoreductase subunit N [Archaeoglobaceae archaeon]|nr:NADH-quinone oxidoreductase subunit N [Archaeoglobaceae archaeon]MDW8118555.1 NADH-quinone oxidoreductase subunit N [Archaeoglobaceae archaeon]